MRICETTKLACNTCTYLGTGLIYHDRPMTCPSCNGYDVYVSTNTKFDSAPSIATDDIPGGIAIRHGLVDESGDPRTFYSKTEIKRAANEAGLVLDGDTPKPYAVKWSGKRE